jgi:hypothetical protein
LEAEALSEVLQTPVHIYYREGDQKYNGTPTRVFGAKFSGPPICLAFYRANKHYNLLLPKKPTLLSGNTSSAMQFSFQASEGESKDQKEGDQGEGKAGSNPPESKSANNGSNNGNHPSSNNSQGSNSSHNSSQSPQRPVPMQLVEGEPGHSHASSHSAHGQPGLQQAGERPQQHSGRDGANMSTPQRDVVMRAVGEHQGAKHGEGSGPGERPALKADANHAPANAPADRKELSVFVKAHANTGKGQEDMFIVQKDKTAKVLFDEIIKRWNLGQVSGSLALYRQKGGSTMTKLDLGKTCEQLGIAEMEVLLLAKK